MDVLLNIGNADLLNLLFLVLTLLIWVLGLYKYFMKGEKVMKELLIALTFFFFFVAGLSGTFGFLETDILSPWGTFWNFIAAVCAFFAAEPWKAF